jgi:probable rRNA maturation factor
MPRARIGRMATPAGRRSEAEVRLTIVHEGAHRLPRGVRAPLVALAARARPAGGTVQLVLGGDALLRRLNREFRDRDEPTDVLSFRYEETAGGAPADAEIYLSLARAAAQARARGHATAREVVLLVLHGLLHLQGHDHHTAADARRMHAAEAAAWRWLGSRWPELGGAPLVAAPERRRGGR